MDRKEFDQRKSRQERMDEIISIARELNDKGVERVIAFAKIISVLQELNDRGGERVLELARILASHPQFMESEKSCQK